ncbi:hypothetical protein Cob_v008960 [Colletotrichum orbiculare MAFF 240422]|uniref:Uncharacterized protein n=1 Tax=Colletotrichum orbiculare (strain 104-T / ATCC 96160 / CBS 514.97 / LARS 414 / MAFF 240422) TaxID=1213857 RepID=A0A484FJA5_COLOR|nr:hypothetical protein Cob_v008960 [Colletotrichum orbiculare MAFF 240422]
MFPNGDWILSEVGRHHQFQAAYCVQNQQGHLVPAPMPPVNLSAVTSEEEVYQHCTVYQYTPTGVTQKRMARVSSATSISSIKAEESRRDMATTTKYRFLVTPPSYASLAHTHPRATVLDNKEGGISPVQMHGRDFVGFTTQGATGEYGTHHEPSAGSGSFMSASYHDSFRQSPTQEDAHGAPSFSTQGFNTEVQHHQILPSDSFPMSFSPVMMSQIGDGSLDDLFHQSNSGGKDTSAIDHGHNEVHEILGDPMPTANPDGIS